jgi:membrane protease YdiL (CAAX protease family)
VTFLFSDPILTSAALFLILALMSMWLTSHKEVPLTLFFISLVAAVYAECITPLGLVYIVVFGVGVSLYQKKWMPRFSVPILAFFILTAGILAFAHKIPGFYNWQIQPPVQVSQNAHLYDFYINFDKGILGFLLIFLLMKPAVTWNDWKPTFKTVFTLFPLTVGAMLGIAYGCGWIYLDIKMPHFLGLWIVVNLFLVSAVEEAFYRGFIQKSLANLVNPWMALLITSAAFVGMHSFFSNDYRYLFMTGIASFFYGAHYILSGRLEASIISHFFINLIHLTFFTYPGLATALAK